MNRKIILFILCTGCASQNSTFSTKGDDNSTLDQGVGQIQWEPAYLLITDVQNGVAKSGTITLTSIGDNTLRIDSIGLSNAGDGVFYAEEKDDLSLAPDQTTSIEVVAGFDATGFAEGEIRVRSNDADNRDLRIPVCAVSEEFTAEYSCGDTTNEDTGQSSESADTASNDTGS